MMKNLFILPLLFLSQYAVAQLSDITYSVQTVNISSFENASGGACWETGDEEYTGYLTSWDNVDGSGVGTGCQTCSNNGNCTFASGINLQTRTNGVYTIYASIDAWEDDYGDRCSYGSDFFTGDDCRRQETQGINLREGAFPSNLVYTDGSRWGSSGDHEWSIRYAWRYAGSANLITPGCALQTHAVTSGAIRSFTANLTAGVTYEFSTCGAGEDTYMRIYGTDGFTIMVSNDDNGALCGGTAASIQYNAPTTGNYYVEISKYLRSPLTTNFNFTHRIMPPEGSFQSNPIPAGTFSTCSFYSSTRSNAVGNCFANNYGEPSDDIYYSFTTAYNGYMEIAHCGSGFDTKIYLMDAAGTLLASNDDNGVVCSGTAASLRALIPAGNYFVVSEGYSTNAGNIATQIRPHTPTGGAISGITNVCQFQTGLTYTITGVSAATNYVWTVPDGAAIVSGQGTTSIIVDFGANGGFVSCTPKNFGDQCVGPTLNFFININFISQPPTAILGITEMCPGINTTLSVDGGFLGAGANWQWYSGSCSGTFLASGNTLVISPSVTTTYFVRASGTCNTTDCVSHTVNVTNDPTATIAGVQSLCEGGSSLLTATVTGGSGSATYQWRRNGVPLANTNSLTYATDTTLSGGLYNFDIVVTQSVTGCGTISQNFPVTVFGDPSVTLLGSTAICPGDSVSLTAFTSGGVGCNAVTWESSADSASGWAPTGLSGTTIKVAPASTTYYRAVYVCNQNGCSPNPAYSNSTVVTVNSCDDNISCTTDICNNGGCIHSPAPGCCTSNANCNDGNACTTNECVSNTCVFTPIICFDGDNCTTDRCIGGQCFYTPLVCNDNDLCTTDTCSNGCLYTPLNCDDSNSCTADSCDAGVCSHDTIGCSVIISGKIHTETGIGIPGVTVILSGDASDTVVTVADGLYSFEVAAGGNYTITPSKANDSITNNGITTTDIALIRRHVLGTTHLNSPYKIIAADATNNSQVSTGDIPLVRIVVLNDKAKFPPANSRLWEFVNSDHDFGAPPYTSFPLPFPKTRTYSQLTTDQTNQNFIGVKIGDVNNSWNAGIP